MKIILSIVALIVEIYMASFLLGNVVPSLDSSSWYGAATQVVIVCIMGAIFIATLLVIASNFKL